MPRDPERMTLILARLELLWSRYPDQRFGQLMSNTMHKLAGFGRDPSFYVEDDALLAHLDRIIETGQLFEANSGGEISPVN